MKIVKVLLFLTSIALWASCAQRQAANEPTEIETPGVGMAPDSANQKLDSAIKAPDTTARKP